MTDKTLKMWLLGQNLEQILEGGHIIEVITSKKLLHYKTHSKKCIFHSLLSNRLYIVDERKERFDMDIYYYYTKML